MKSDPQFKIATVTDAWLETLRRLIGYGEPIAPRGQKTIELPQLTFIADMRHPVLMTPKRSLNYRFMAAEALWILEGEDRVETIAPWNSRIAQFSDDGKTFFGAYGPRYVAQLPYVVNKLMNDPDTRQAGLTLWRPCPPETKDVPCTIALFFQIRNDKLNCHVFMRSSDAWLGLPYDTFNFSMIAHQVCGFLNQHRRGSAARNNKAEPDDIEPGSLFLTAASSHLYERDLETARACLTSLETVADLETPKELFHSGKAVLTKLAAIRDQPGRRDRWWELAP